MFKYRWHRVPADERAADQSESGRPALTRPFTGKQIRQTLCRCPGCAFFTGILLLVVGILVVFYAESLVNALISRMLAFSETSDTFKSYRTPPIEIRTKVYFFNLTNRNEFVNGSQKPHFQEVGPYVVAERWERQNVTFYDNGTVSSRLHRTLRFAREYSVGGESDIIVTLNVPYASSLLQAIQGKQNAAQMNVLLNVLKQYPTVRRTVNDLVFGYEDPLLQIAQTTGPPGQSMPFTKFGFFVGKNNSVDPPLLVNTGVSDWRRTGVIERFDGSPYLTFWNSNSCNRVNGSDGSLFPPGLTPNSSVYLFARDMCRSLLLEYERTARHDGVETLRFTPPEDIFDPPEDRPENTCFCVDGPPCAPRGLFNISQCQYGSPTYISFPHFYLADPSLLDDLVGLEPNKSKHQFYIDIVSRLGIAMNAKIRMQINFHLQPHPTIVSSRNLPTMYFPVFWMEAGVDQLPDEVVSLVHQALGAPLMARTSMSAVTFTLSLLVLLVGGAYVFRRRLRRKRRNMVAEETSVKNGAGGGGASGGGAGKSVEMTGVQPGYVPYSSNV